MDRKEAILRIKDHMEHHGIGKYPHLKLKEALDMAITALSPPNEPLTLEQLREMDGEPVWFDTIKRWGIVKVCRDGVFVLTKSGEFEVGRCKYYRRPPEGGEDT